MPRYVYDHNLSPANNRALAYKVHGVTDENPPVPVYNDRGSLAYFILPTGTTVSNEADAMPRDVVDRGDLFWTFLLHREQEKMRLMYWEIRLENATRAFRQRKKELIEEARMKPSPYYRPPGQESVDELFRLRHEVTILQGKLDQARASGGVAQEVPLIENTKEESERARLWAQLDSINLVE